MANKLFVGGLAWATTDDTLRQFFAQVGQVATANVVTDKFTGKSRGFGFVEMATDEEAEKAKTELNGKELDGRTISINDARPQEPRDNNFSGSRGGFGGGQRGGDRNRRDTRRSY